MTSLYGAAADFKTEADVSVKDLIAYVIAERDATKLPAILTNPDEATVKDSTAAAFLNAGESANRLLDGARRAKSEAVMRVFKMITHHITDYGIEGYKETVPGAKLTIYITGKEAIKGKPLSERKGEEIEMAPEDFEGLDLDKTLEIVPGAMSQSQKAALYEYKRQQVMDGVATVEDLMEVEYEDVTKQTEKVETERLTQEQAPYWDNLFLLYGIELLREHGYDFSWMYLQSPEGQPAALSAGMPSGNGLNVGPTAAPPATTVPSAGVGM